MRDGLHPTVCKQNFRLPLTERLVYNMAGHVVQNLIDSLFDPDAEWKRERFTGEIHRPHRGRWYPMSALSPDYPNTVFYANGWGRHIDVWPLSARLIRSVAERQLSPKPKPKPAPLLTVGWTEADEKNERRLYEAGRSAFWLNPNRWTGVKPGELMNLEEPPMLEGHEMLAVLAGRQTASPPAPYVVGKTRLPPPVAAKVDRAPVLATSLEDGGLGYALGKH